jgi:hypothetical protein
MARPRKTACYDADAATIKKFFAESLGAREEQNAASGLISSINSEMEAAGVHPGVMSTMRKIKAMPDGKRGPLVPAASLRRRARERAARPRVRRPDRSAVRGGWPPCPFRACAWCCGRLSNGSAFCSPECEGSYAKLMPRLGDAGSDDVEFIRRGQRRRRDLAGSAAAKAAWSRNIHNGASARLGPGRDRANCGG